MLELSGTIDRARDLTLLQCYTGVRISDLFRLEYNIFNKKFQLETKKVAGNYITIPMTPSVLRIMEKYSYKLPKMSEKTYREYIKELYKRVNPEAKIQIRRNGEFKTVFVWEEISSHDNVRTFITLSAQRGMTISDIAMITGKTEKIILQNYLVESQKIAEESMLKAWGTPLKIAQ
jgi:integrase